MPGWCWCVVLWMGFFHCNVSSSSLSSLRIKRKRARLTHSLPSMASSWRNNQRAELPNKKRQIKLRQQNKRYPTLLSVAAQQPPSAWIRYSMQLGINRQNGSSCRRPFARVLTAQLGRVVPGCSRTPLPWRTTMPYYRTYIMIATKLMHYRIVLFLFCVGNKATVLIPLPHSPKLELLMSYTLAEYRQTFTCTLR